MHQGGGGGTNMGQRQLSVVSDSRLLDDEIKQEVKVILRPKRPPRPQSEVFLDKVDGTRRSKRYSAFGVRFFFFSLLFLIKDGRLSPHVILSSSICSNALVCKPYLYGCLAFLVSIQYTPFQNVLYR